MTHQGERKLAGDGLERGKTEVPRPAPKSHFWLAAILER